MDKKWLKKDFSFLEGTGTSYGYVDSYPPALLRFLTHATPLLLLTYDYRFDVIVAAVLFVLYVIRTEGWRRIGSIDICARSRYEMPRNGVSTADLPIMDYYRS